MNLQLVDSLAKIINSLTIEEKQILQIGLYDLQIASIAIANKLILVTHNVAEFQRIDKLNIEDWEI